MPIPPDMTDDEIEGLEITETCTCSICRLGREVVRRRREAEFSPEATKPQRPSALRIA